MTSDFDFMTALELRRLIAARAISPVELTEHALARAEASQASLNAFCHLMPEEARSAARRAEEAVMCGSPLGLLHGLPVSVKDLIAVGGQPYASGSRAMASNVAAADAPAVERLRAAGAIIIGKTTTSEFGAKPVGDSPLTGITRHPWDLAKTPGGSSAGAAASVAAGITPFALGTDGGGSLRIPAALTGLVGLKAQFGRVPVWPTSATPTLAHVGALARDVADAALLTMAVAGHDPRDPFAVAGPVPDLLGAVKASVAGLRVAWSATLGYARPNPEVAAIARAAAMTLADQGAIVEEVETVFESDPAALWTAEFYAGIGTRLRGVLESRRDLLDPAVADVLDAALAQEMRAYYETVFARYALRDRMVSFFTGYDVLVSPTLPISSLEAGRNIPEGLEDRSLVSWAFYTYPFNLTGQPAASVCAGIASDGMPVGLQIVGRALGEADVIRTAAAIERTKPPGYNLRPLTEP
ncbi:amidase-related enzyme [Methylorubrum extorquens]|uniref:Amidase-related enzyme n=1 Tax=Methylorubrum extorquens TaxID=408 RepID=A0A2N9ANS3_METEX|nr:amidase family protein [Methylorubrum zatmanii]ARO56992.1 amidase [Methylorubrum zatmanii]KQQ17522.1 amidase [Methylobacterium sp. Leaf121]SOR28943.1 amidase-related enzyme [Methylorubrum extorquens]